MAKIELEVDHYFDITWPGLSKDDTETFLSILLSEYIDLVIV